MRLPFAVLVAAAASTAVDALPTVSRVGRYLYDSTGTRFYVKGIAYQPAGTLSAQTTASIANGGFPEPSSYIDPLADTAGCERDIPYFTQAGINAVRVYSVNSSLDHSGCMNAFNAAGIYTIIDLSLPLNGSIDRASPAWTTSLLDEYITTINAFDTFSNVLAFNVGNEIVTSVANTNTAPFIKAAARDTKAYLKSINSTALVGYSSTDGDANDWRNALASYLSCASEGTSIDLYGLNNYEWCGTQASYAASPWNATTETYASFNIPAYLSEYGCISSGTPRGWTEVPALYNSQMSDVWSGGVAFSWFPTSDGYGMVSFTGADNATVVTSTDFTNFQAALSNVTTLNTPAQSSVSATSYPTCPSLSSIFLASSTLPPTPDDAVCNCLEQSAFRCVTQTATNSEPVVIGDLLNYACSTLLPSDPGSPSCSAIASNGTSGVYGSLAYCSPSVQLSYAFSAHLVASSYNPVACDFSGNATINTNAPTTADSASSAASSCLALLPSGGVFTPTTPGNTASNATSTQKSASSGVASASASASATKASAADQTNQSCGRVVFGAIAVFGVAIMLGKF